MTQLPHSVLITGGTGSFGKTMLRELLAAGEDPQEEHGRVRAMFVDRCDDCLDALNDPGRLQTA